MLNHQAAVAIIIERVIACAKKKIPKEQIKLVSKFISLYYVHSCADDLEVRRPEDLFSAAYSHWQLMQNRAPGESKIQVINPKVVASGWESTHTIVQLILDDMPFLIDSLVMELNRMGMTIHLTVYTGGIKVLRANDHQLIDIFANDDQTDNAPMESPIYFEIDRQADVNTLLEIEENLRRVLIDVSHAYHDWELMQDCMRHCIDEITHQSMPQKAAEVHEVLAFLHWLLANHFVFLGSRDYEMVGKGESAAMRLITGTGLGVLRDETHSKILRYFSELPEDARYQVLSPEHILILSKTNTRSTVHRYAYTDYVGVKRFNKDGELIGERRFIGLYTSIAYRSSPDTIPFLRRKVAEILKMSHLPTKSYGGKDLMNILSTIPRDDLIQGSIDDLYDLAIGILHLQERRRTRLFVRKDAYNRYFSCLVFIPSDNFTTELMHRMQEILKKAFHGVEVSVSIQFSESILASIHYNVRVDPKKKLKLEYNVPAIEKKLIEVGQSWQDVLRQTILEHFDEERGNLLIQQYISAFPVAYRDVFSPREAVFDIEKIETVPENALGMSFYRSPEGAKNEIKFKLYRASSTVPLSDALPMLENMGLRVIREMPYQIILANGREYWINDLSMTYVPEPTFEVENVRAIFQEAFSKTWVGEAENDTLNHLVLAAQLTWREIVILRSYAKYLRQTGFTFSPQYIAETLVKNAHIAKLLVELFKCSFDPEFSGQRKASIEQTKAQILTEMNRVVVLDEDRILHRILDVIHATLRTNYFQVDEDGKPRPYLAFKFDPAKIPDLPLPLPKFEIYVYSPSFEGVHLRAGKIARGGIRWSDRREDYRTEVLGLMKAQQVKNALIVPAGAKGGFVVKSIHSGCSAELVRSEGIACYRGFISGLLDLTDNLVGNEIVPPLNTVCYDEPDYYLVVAADKGTATFSDIANQIALDRNFWLGDAFASGGSTGYDHKKIGITARGAWVSAERHFQELGVNVDESEITVIGIGDMSGDVFGNGMLMSPHIKLVAAFNHTHIFIDPNPDPAQSYAERQRLFQLPQSTWEDYDVRLISQGGGVFRRSLKAITISPEMKKLLELNKDVLIPNDLIKAILKAPVDLIWNGGIGTFVKASVQTNAEVGDRSNDHIRINGNEVRAGVVCEGGNLGFTQLARIEYEFKGGKINTDFIDNSGGVDCSDHEVNIKIFLNNLTASGELTVKARNQLLQRMTDEVANLVLQDNYHQNQALSVASYLSPKHMLLYMRYIDSLEEQKKINRALEFLPDNKALMERKTAGLGLTRPELAILMSYSKIVLDTRIRKSKLTTDPYLMTFIKDAFPTQLVKRYGTLLHKHRLSHEIISTQISNRLVSEMGITFVYQMYDETGATTAAIVRAYSVAREVFNLASLYADIESLDYKVEPNIQHQMTVEAIGLIRRATRWFLRNRRGIMDISKSIKQFSDYVGSLNKRLPKFLRGGEKASFEERHDALIASNVPEDIAIKFASLSPMYHALNIIEAALVDQVDLFHAAKIYFILVNRLDLVWFREQINAFPVDSRWIVLAKSAFKGDLDWSQRELTASVLRVKADKQRLSSQVNAWFEIHRVLIDRWQQLLKDLRSVERKEFAILAFAVRQLLGLAQTSAQAISVQVGDT